MIERALRTFNVGVFEHRREGVKANGKPYTVKLEAYTTWYSPSWKGCCLHVVTAPSGTAAKNKALVFHRDRCMASR